MSKRGPHEPKPNEPRRGMPRFVSFIVLLAILLLVAALSYMVMASFLLPMFLAVLLGVIFRPLHVWFIGRCRGHDRVAAGMTTIAILLIVLLPTLLILVQASVEAYHMASGIGGKEISGRLEQLLREYNLAPLPKEVGPSLNALASRINEISKAGSDEDQIAPADNAAFFAQELAQLETLVSKSQLPQVDGRAPAERELERRAGTEAALAKFRAATQTLVKAESDGPERVAAAAAAAREAFDELDGWIRGNTLQQVLREQLAVDGDAGEMLRTKISQTAGPLALGAGQFAGNVLIGLIVGGAVMIISLYYFLADGPAMVRTIMRLSPLDDRYEAQLVAEFGKVSRAVVVATLLSAFVQGLLASVGYFLCGFENLFLLTVMTMLFAMIPFVGAASVWGACSLWLFYFDNNMGAAIGLAIYGVLVVSMVDNLIKPMILHGQSNLHPLLALLSVLGGAKALGPIGIFIGPMVVAFLQALLNMMQTELAELGDSGPAPDSAAS